MKTIIDLGCGDGRFIYKQARENPQNHYIGIDPMLSQTKEYQRKINREKLQNVEFIESSVENLPNSALGKGDDVHVYFPWGSLLGGIANADPEIIKNICSLVAEKGRLQIVFGYSEDAEPSEVKRLGLEDISLEKVQDTIIPEFEHNGLRFTFLEEIDKEDLLEIETTWSKKLAFGGKRKIFKIVLDRI